MGDSEAWLVAQNETIVLTSSQQRKPLVGAGALGVAFERMIGEGYLVVGSDGLFKYVPEARIRNVLLARNADPAAALLGAARTSAGTLQDDTSVIVVELDPGGAS